MPLVQIIGFGLTFLAYGIMWALIFKSRNIIEEINSQGLSKLREIEEALNL